MCQYKNLYHNKDGYVLRCSSCKNIQIAFGTTGLNLTCDQFDDFVMSVQHLHELHNSVEFPDRKQVIVPTVSKSVTVMCSPNELNKLNTLLLRGRNNIEMAKLFVFNEN